MPKIEEKRFEAEWSTVEDIEAARSTGIRKTLHGAQKLARQCVRQAGFVVVEKYDGLEWVEVCRYTADGNQYNV